MFISYYVYILSVSPPINAHRWPMENKWQHETNLSYICCLEQETFALYFFTLVKEACKMNYCIPVHQSFLCVNITISLHLVMLKLFPYVTYIRPLTKHRVGLMLYSLLHLQCLQQCLISTRSWINFKLADELKGRWMNEQIAGQINVKADL